MSESSNSKKQGSTLSNNLIRASIHLTVIGALAAASAAAQAQQAPPSPDDNAPLQEVIVTGSLIRRTDSETPSPVQVITAADLTNSGYSDLSDVLRTLSANGAGTLSQSFNNAFAGGGAGVALRGLSVGATLTLVDNHRMVGYPLTDDGERNFVDVTALPMLAVDRIEVLKDGASAEYGSDAIAGVVNVLLKKDYQGADMLAEGGTSEHTDGTTAHIGGIWGVGDLTSDGWNFYVSAEYRHQDNIKLTARSGDAFAKLNFTDVGGVNTTPGAGSNPTTTTPTSLTGILANPTTGAQTFLPGCNATGYANDSCTAPYPGLQLQPTTSAFNVLSKFTVKLSDNWEAVTTASIFRTTSEQAGDTYASTAWPSGSAIIGLPPKGLPNINIVPPITVPANYPGNTIGAGAQLIYNFPELGWPVSDFATNTYRLVEDVSGSIAGWDVAAYAGYMYSFMTVDNYGFTEPGALQQALNNGYILGGSNGASLFAPMAQATNSSYLYDINANASHALFALPGGDARIAFGAEWYENKLSSSAPLSNQSGLQNSNDAWALGSQADSAAFMELNAPILKSLEANAALRYDHYNTNAGGQATPKLGIKYQPIEMLALRATWGKGFRAPSIPETSSGAAFLANTIPDPTLCPGGNAKAVGAFPSQCVVQLVGLQSGTSTLKPEKSTNYTFGVVFEPIHQISVSADYYDIKINQDIISAFEAGGLGFGGLSQLERLGPQVTLPQVQPDGTLAPALTPVPLITFKTYPYINASQDETNGIDVDLRSHMDMGAAGKFSAELSYTHILTYKLEALGVTYELAGTHGPSGVSGDTGNPKDRATLSLTWEKGGFSATTSINYVGSFSVTDPSAGMDTCAAAVDSAFSLEFGSKFLPGSTFPSSYCKVASFTDVDLYAAYKLTDQLAVHVSVLNAFNTQAPFDAVTYGGGGGASYSTLDQAGAVGRFYNVGMTYKFH
jgi:iron complex outermembrane receptor protein